MKTWFLSKNKSVSGPFSANEVIEIVENDAQYYGWNPSFSQWKPVGIISEFASLVPALAPPAQISQVVIDEFISKKASIQVHIESLQARIKITQTYLNDFEQQVNEYKRLTANLNESMKSNINPYVQHYKNYHRIYDDLVAALAIAKREAREVVLEFDKRMALRDIEALVNSAIVPMPIGELEQELGFKQELKPKLTQADLNQSEAPAKDECDSKVTGLDPVAQSPKKSGLTGMFKSVFKTDSKQEKVKPEYIAPSEAPSQQQGILESPAAESSGDAEEEKANKDAAGSPHYWDMLQSPRTIY
ncbi:hypothetical protein [Shewanella maritima]|uniref:hypothetical protein n=1 Tax=Shewanella maritima TaxID=2520507 RepID=UPI003734C83A